MASPGASAAGLGSWYERNRRLVWGTAAGAAAIYAAYRVYHSESVARTNGQLNKLAIMFAEYSAALGSAGECASLVTADLHAYLNSDSNEVPRSLAQLSKLLQSAELQGTVQASAASLARGVAQATALFGVGSLGAEAQGSSALEKITEAILSDRGRSLLGMAVGIATKNATTTFCEYLNGSGAFASSSSSASEVGTDGSEDGGTPRQHRQRQQFGPKELLALMASEHGQRVLSMMITKSMRTAVSTYCEAYAGYNAYDDILKALSQPAHRDAVTDIMSRMTGAFCREVALAYRKSRVPINSGSSNIIASGTPHTAGDEALSGSAPNALLRSSSSVDATRAASSSGHNKHNALKAMPAAASSGGGGGGHAASGTVVSWLKQAAEVARERDLRSLAVDVACASTREATREAISTFLRPLYGTDGPSALLGSLTSLAPCVSTQKVFVLMSMLISLMMYAVSPRMLVV